MSGASYSELRTLLDGSDKFVSGGHGVIKTAGATRHAERMRKVPVWAFDDQKIRQFIEHRFPGFRDDPEQRKLASRTVRLIHLYYRVGATAIFVAEELKMSVGSVKDRLHRLERDMDKPFGKRGRPRKNALSIQATNGSNGADHTSL